MNASRRWYLVVYTSQLDTLRETLPIAPGTPRLSRSGQRAIVSLTEWAEGALSHEQATARMQTDAWRRDDEQ